jgi:multidrug transporter EmrE-like cation transporter
MTWVILFVAGPFEIASAVGFKHAGASRILMRLVCIGLIVIGVVGVKLASGGPVRQSRISRRTRPTSSSRT